MKQQTKPLIAYEGLTSDKKRLASKLIVALHEGKLDSSVQLDIRRLINRSKRDPGDTGKRYTNGYLVFMKRDFPRSKRTNQM
jgi:hypothetical protein